MKITKPGHKKYCKALFYAPGGHGKTHLLGTAQEDDRTYPSLLLDWDGGTETLDGLDIDVVHIRTWKGFDESYEMLASGKHDYRSVSIDSISEVHRFALLDILRVAGPSRNDKDLLEQRDYGKASVQMRRLLRMFRDLPMHVFFSALAKDVEAPRRIRVPDLAGAMAEEAAGLVSVVGYLALSENGDGEEERILLLNGNSKYRIKARMPWGETAPEEIVEPTITTILDELGY